MGVFIGLEYLGQKTLLSGLCENHDATFPSESNGGSNFLRCPFSQCKTMHVYFPSERRTCGFTLCSSCSVKFRDILPPV